MLLKSYLQFIVCCLLPKNLSLMGQYGVWPICIIILLTSLAKCSISLPINDQVPEEPRPWLNNLTEYDTARYVGRTLKVINWDSCEFGDTLDPYDESCPNGATGILPCNPGQLKIAECIGQDGDRSRMCDPCPQKYYQSFYNRCTECHRCSECGPNEQIRQPCTDETDTVCESIIPPDPVPTTTPTPTADAPVPSLSTQNIDESTPRVATTAASTPQTTRKGPFYTEGPVLTITTTQNISVLEPGTRLNKGINWKALAIIVIVLFFLVVAILIAIIWKQRVKIRQQKRKLKNIVLNDMPCDGGHEERGGSVHQSGKSKCKSNGNNILMKKMDSRSPSSLPSASELCADPENVQDPSAAHHDSDEGGRDQDLEPNRTTVLADIHITPENIHDTDTHRDAPSRPKPSPKYKNLNGMNQTNMEAPSTSGGSSSINSDGPCAMGPEQDDGGAIADPPKTLHSTTPRPKQEGLHKADPLMQQQASPEVVTKEEKGPKKKRNH